MKTKKRVLSLLLSGVMTLSLLPSAAFAVEAAETQEQPAVVVDDTQASSANDGVSVMSDADTQEGEVNADAATQSIEPEISWSRTNELKWSKTGLADLVAGDRSNYQRTANNKTTVSWSWDAISSLPTTIQEPDKVWDYNTDEQYANPTPSSDALGIKKVEGLQAATWNNRTYTALSGIYVNDSTRRDYQKGQFEDFDEGTANHSNANTKSYTARKISGTFTWPEGYDLSDNIELVSENDGKYSKIYEQITGDDLKNSFGGKKVLAINDDVYAFIYRDGDTLTSSNYKDYMAFWTGTAGKGVWSTNSNTQNWHSSWNVTSPATYGTENALRAFQKVVPNTDTTINTSREQLPSETIENLSQSDGWYAFMDGNSLSTVLDKHYKNDTLEGQTFHVDFYCFDTDKVGGMDKLKIRFTKEDHSVPVTVRYWLNEVTTPDDTGHYLDYSIMTGKYEEGDTINLPEGYAVNELNYRKALAIDKADADVSDGVQNNPDFTVTADKDKNIINVVYTSTGSNRSVSYTYDFGVKNTYSNVFTDEEKRLYSQAKADASDVAIDWSRNTISYTPSDVNTSKEVTITLKGSKNSKKVYVRFLPETNVLYEETFMTNSGDSNVWATVGSNDSTTVTDNGSGSVYGYTEAYDKDSNGTFSNGSAYMASLMLLGDATSVRTEADKTFTFSGTGFDLISECGTNTGMLIVGVKNTQTNEVVKGYIVDTYFSGDNNEETGSIISGEGILAYQIPVVRAMDLPRGKYEVTVRGYITESAGAIVNKGSDNIARTKSAHTSKKDLAKAILRDAGMEEYCKNVELSYMDDNSVLNGGTGAAVSTPKSKNAIARTSAANRDNAVQVYIDGFRVYQPRSDESSYVDREKGLNYHSIYDYLTANEDPYTETDIANSAVYVETDGDINSVNGNPATIETYKEKGPENEVYLTTDNFVGFALEDYNGTGTVMVSAKSINDDATLSAIKNGRIQEVKDLDECGTEMYYDVTKYVFKSGDKYYLILGNGEDDENSVLSISGIKLPKGTTSTSSAETSNAIAKMVSLAYQEDTTFAPKYFKVHAKSKVKAGKRTTIKATASTTADHIAIYTNSKCTKPVSSKTKAIQPDNKKAVRKGTAKRYTFHASVKIAKRQKYNYYVVAYDKNGKASDPVKVSITGKR